MSILWVSVPVAVILLGLLWFAARGYGHRVRSAGDLSAQLRPVDLESFQNLMDPEEEEFLRHNLPLSEFRAIQRERLRAAAEYVGVVTQNAAVLLRFGEAARMSPDAEVAAAGVQLAERAIRVRMLSLRALVELRIGVVFPGMPMRASKLIHGYQQTQGLARSITRMKSSEAA
jgi:hypothetical protein